MHREAGGGHNVLLSRVYSATGLTIYSIFVCVCVLCSTATTAFRKTIMLLLVALLRAAQNFSHNLSK